MVIDEPGGGTNNNKADCIDLTETNPHLLNTLQKMQALYFKPHRRVLHEPHSQISFWNSRQEKMGSYIMERTIMIGPSIIPLSIETRTTVGKPDIVSYTVRMMDICLMKPYKPTLHDSFHPAWQAWFMYILDLRADRSSLASLLSLQCLQTICCYLEGPLERNSSSKASMLTIFKVKDMKILDDDQLQADTFAHVFASCADYMSIRNKGIDLSKLLLDKILRQRFDKRKFQEEFRVYTGVVIFNGK